MNTPLIINLIAGPGTGKSILACDVFSKLKRNFVSCELASEYVKDKVYEESKKTIENQIYIFAKQQHKIFRLKDKVDVIVTDSPIMLSPVYDSSECNELRKLVIKEFKKYPSLNYLIVRDETIPYENYGRNQDLDGAMKVDKKIRQILSEENIEYSEIQGIGEDSLNTIITDVLDYLKR
jgi:nicotinamide riboside kinase